MKAIFLSFVLALPMSAAAVIGVPANLGQEDSSVRALIESEVNDFDVDRDHALLEKAIDLNPLSLLTESMVHLTSNSPLWTPFNADDLKNPNDWKRQFRLVIWINRAASGPTAQTMHVYQDGERVMANRISTGAPGHGTPPGYFTIQWFSRNHRSSLYGNTPMPFAIFFNGHIAMHERPPNTQHQIGKPASHGCVRITRNPDGSKPAEKLFDLALSMGKGDTPVFTRDGRPVYDDNGQLKMRTAYKTLIIVDHRGR